MYPGEPALQAVRLAVREAHWQVRDCDRHPPAPRQAGHWQVRGGPHRAQVRGCGYNFERVYINLKLKEDCRLFKLQNKGH